MSEKYSFIDAEKAHYPVVKMCAWLKVSTSGFYAWRDRPASATARRRARLAVLVQAIFDASDGTYGYRRIHAALLRQGEDCGPELVRDIMRELGLVPCQPRPWRPTTTQPGAGAEIIPDLVGRDFTADAPGTKLVGDITYLPTWQGFCYLATVIDCCTKECIGYAIADHMRAELVIDALRMAARNYQLQPEAIFHSDHGSNYTSDEFGRFLTSQRIRHSVGRTGICYDNAMAESFFSAIKNEWLHRFVFTTRAKAKRQVIRYIEGFYNRRRLHSALGYRPPLEVLNESLSSRTAA